MEAGLGSAHDGINCRCTTTIEFFDDEQELAAWLADGT